MPSQIAETAQVWVVTGSRCPLEWLLWASGEKDHEGKRDGGWEWGWGWRDSTAKLVTLPSTG